jgi:Leucine rich repeat
VLVTVTIAVLTEKPLKSNVSCERIEEFEWYPEANHKTCFTQALTIIDSIEFSFSTARDEKMEGLWLTGKSVTFLPIQVNETFPNLMIYEAGSLSIKELARENFLGLKKLKSLNLYGNKIERIASDIFIDLTSLENLILCENFQFSTFFYCCLILDNNQLQFIHPNVFKSLKNLQKVFLRENRCIDEDFEGKTEILKLTHGLKEKCNIN